MLQEKRAKEANSSSRMEHPVGVNTEREKGLMKQAKDMVFDVCLVGVQVSESTIRTRASTRRVGLVMKSHACAYSQVE